MFIKFESTILLIIQSILTKIFTFIKVNSIEEMQQIQQTNKQTVNLNRAENQTQVLSEAQIQNTSSHNQVQALEQIDNMLLSKQQLRKQQVKQEQIQVKHLQGNQISHQTELEQTLQKSIFQQQEFHKQQQNVQVNEDKTINQKQQSANQHQEDDLSIKKQKQQLQIKLCEQKEKQKESNENAQQQKKQQQKNKELEQKQSKQNIQVQQKQKEIIVEVQKQQKENKEERENQQKENIEEQKRSFTNQEQQQKEQLNEIIQQQSKTIQQKFQITQTSQEEKLLKNQQRNQIQIQNKLILDSQVKQNTEIQQQNEPEQQISPTFSNRKRTTAVLSPKKQKNQSFIKMLQEQISCIEDLELRIVINMGKKVDIGGRLIVTTYRIIFLQQIVPNIKQLQSKSQKQLSSNTTQVYQQKQPTSQKNMKIQEQQKQNQVEFQNPLKKQEFKKLFCFPIGYIFKCERSVDQSTGLSYLQITLKTSLNIKIRYPSNKYSSSSKANQIILNLMSKNVFVALDQGKNKSDDKLCQKYSLDFNIEGLEGAYYYDNFQWNQMISYPQKFVVPLPYIGKRKTQYRLVVLSTIYKLKQDKIGLWRTGPGNPDPSEDQWVPKAKHTKKHLAIQIKNKGIGTSKSLAARTFQLENLSLLKDSFQKMHSFSYHGNQPTKWISNMINSKWYQQIALLIQQAFIVIDMITQGTHVTLLSDTQSRGAQISAIVQILLTAEYRTFDGFSKLVEKQFLHYGVQRPSKKQKQEDKGIILIQFFDCVYQLCHIYPLSFEFNKNYLVFIAQHVYSGKYGNFLYITKTIKETKKSQILRCACIWKDIKQKIQKSKSKLFCPQDSDQKQTQDYYNYFRNCFFIDPKESDIMQLRSHVQISKSIKFWTQYFSKKTFCLQILQEYQQNRDPIQLRYQNISKSFNKMKRQNEILKRKLGDQHKSIVQQKSILKQMGEI